MGQTRVDFNVNFTQPGSLTTGKGTNYVTGWKWEGGVTVVTGRRTLWEKKTKNIHNRFCLTVLNAGFSQAASATEEWSDSINSLLEQPYERSPLTV